MRLPEKYENEMKDLLQEEYEAYKESLSLPIQQGYRINTGKISKEEWEKIAPFSAKEVPWIENGYFLLDDFRASRHPYYFAGLYYLQEPSAMTPANRLNVEPGDFVLDLCAAPGGKATELGSRLKGKGMLVANDISNSRAKALLKNLELAGSYHQEPMSYPALLSWCEKQASLFAPYICDTGNFLENALASNKKVVLEAQLGAMRDIDYGIFPYTSSSSTISAYGPIGAGIPGESLDHVVGVLKAYSTCVGAGPFVAERAMSEDWCNILRKFGNEYGAATGRPRRVGPFDAVASRYGLKCQHADKIALTKLDVLSSLTEIPVITAYERNHETTTVFDPTENIDSFSPVVTMLPGWKQDISACRKYEDLPKNARLYIETLERLLDCDIQFISTGAERNEYMIKGEWL